MEKDIGIAYFLTCPATAAAWQWTCITSYRMRGCKAWNERFARICERARTKLPSSVFFFSLLHCLVWCSHSIEFKFSRRCLSLIYIYNVGIPVKGEVDDVFSDVSYTRCDINNFFFFFNFWFNCYCTFIWCASFHQKVKYKRSWSTNASGYIIDSGLYASLDLHRRGV